MIYDLLPIDHPEFFWKKEPERHRKRLDFLGRRGAGAIVLSRTVGERLHREMERLGRPDFPILSAHPPLADVFYASIPKDSALANTNYFITCGTIEPRKNHRLLLRVWHRLIDKLGSNAPKLVIIGKRGWLCDEIVAEIHDPAMRSHVLEATSLTSSDYRTLLGHSRALLAPSFGEGFGLPVAEALTCGTPVIASDIPPFREQDGGSMTFLHPEKDDEWYEAVLQATESGPSLTGLKGSSINAEEAVRHYVETITAFLQNLPPSQHGLRP